MNNKTIILLSSKRTGSSAFFKVFKSHPKVNCLLKRKDMDMLELNFWNSAYEAINGNQINLKKMLRKINFNEHLPSKLNKKKIFFLWKKILNKNGGIIFDKSPNYLNKYETLNLINDFIKCGNKVVIFGLIRDPRDAISSQHELWDKSLSKAKLILKVKKREKKWLSQYENLERFQNSFKFKVYKYEHICNNKNKSFKEIFKKCNLVYNQKYTIHIKPTSIGRYSLTFYRSLKKWKFSSKFKKHLSKYGYDKKIRVDKINYITYFPGYIKRLLPIKVYLFLAYILNAIKSFLGLEVKRWR